MTLQLTGSGTNSSVILVQHETGVETFNYSPFGTTASRNEENACLPGFNGERSDPMTRVTHLGCGYRAYNPALMRFTCPDSESPFGVGGINPYVYCESDPVNLTDPSGHGPLMWIVEGMVYLIASAGMAAEVSEAAVTAIGITETVVSGLSAATSMATGIASKQTETSNPQLSQALGWASLGLGITSAAFGIPKVTGRIYKGMHKSSSRLTHSRGDAGIMQGSEGQYRRNSYSSFSQKKMRALENGKQVTFDGEENLAGWAKREGLAKTTKVNAEKDFSVLSDTSQAHKFIFNEDGDLMIGSITKKTDPKRLSHPVLAADAGDAKVISAGYIYKFMNKIYVVNHSGHYRPPVESLDSVHNHISSTFGMQVTKIKANSYKHGLLKLFR
ncbi:RHS repeat-associated core domain-containing protein [Rahnella bonaserana]|jgi:RHS repeat-associated protein